MFPQIICWLYIFYEIHFYCAVKSVNVIVAFMNIVILITVVETKDKSVSLHGTYILEQ